MARDCMRRGEQTMTTIIDTRDHDCTPIVLCAHYDDPECDDYCEHDSCIAAMHDTCFTCFTDGCDANAGYLDEWIALLHMPNNPTDKEFNYYMYSTRNNTEMEI
jgi:hypothetical protein